MPKSHGTKDFWLSALRAETTIFSATVSQDEVLESPVPSCPGWNVADLVRHLGGVYCWVTSHLTRGTTDKPDLTSTDYDEGKTPLLSWWTEASALVLSTLETTDPELPAWNWAPQPKKALFWHRRMAHETAIHRWDAQMATGLAEPIEPRLAADGLSEAFDTHLASGRGRLLGSATGVIALQATDIDEIWYVRLRAEGVALLDTETLLDGDDHHERATASGTASDLMLAVYERIPFEVLHISGDAGLLSGLGLTRQH